MTASRQLHEPELAPDSEPGRLAPVGEPPLLARATTTRPAEAVIAAPRSTDGTSDGHEPMLDLPRGEITITERTAPATTDDRARTPLGRLALDGGVALAGAAAMWGAAIATEAPTSMAIVAAATGSIAALLAWRTWRTSARHIPDGEAVRELLGDGAGDCLWSWQPARGTAWFSSRWRATYEVEPGVADDLTRWLTIVHPADAERMKRGLDELAAGGRSELRLIHRLRVGDEWRWADLNAASKPDGARVRIAGSISDITERRRTEARLAYSAFHDTLTGLPNRALLLDRLAHSVARARRNPRYQFAVMFIDIDGFKIINDSLGHSHGDALLTMVANRLAACVRPGDTVARLGGDEFTVLLDPVDSREHTEQIAERLSQAVHGTFEVLGHTIKTSASIGIAFSDARYTNPQDLLRDADTAMYRAKRAGKGQQRLFDIAMHTSAMRRLEIESELCRAVERKTFIVHYQPIVRLDTGAIVGLEALVRMRAESGALISPGEFIPVAEESGMIDAVLHAVLADAAVRAKRWRARHPHLYISVNVSGRSLRPDLVDQVSALLRTHELDPAGLKLELTETVLVDVASASGEILDALRGIGVGLYIDDFGTGYSSLSYLHKFPVERLKLDRSFVSSLDGTRVPGIVETVIELSKHLNAGVIAEGIETAAQLAALQELSCSYGQGWHFAPALPADEVERLLDKLQPIGQDDAD